MIGLSAVVVLTGCAQTTTLHVWRPAEMDVTGIERLAVLDFNGPHNSGQIARSALVAQFWKDGFYSLVDQSELEGITPVSAPAPSGPPDVGSAIEAGRTLGVDAILVGDVVSYHATDDVTTDQRVGFINSDEHDGKNDLVSSLVGFGFENNETVTREVSASLAFQLIDCKTGQIRAARQSSHTETGRMRNGEGYLPARERTLTEMMHNCACDVVEMISPHQVTVKVGLAGGGFGRAAAEIRRGNGSAVQGDWRTAEEHWQSALELDPDNHAAKYNLGLAHEARYDYDRAQELYADALKGRRRSLYAGALKRIAGDREDYRVAMSQTNRRSPPGATPNSVYAGDLPASGATNDQQQSTPFPVDDDPRLTPYAARESGIEGLPSTVGSKSREYEWPR